MLRRVAASISEVTLQSIGTRSTMAKIPRNLDKLSRPYSMFSKEKSLPNLPVPPLQQTLEKYLASLIPLLTKDEFKRTEEIVKEFGKPNGIGELLHSKILEKALTTDNWLADWWDNVAYFNFTAPVVINSSPGLVFPHVNFQSQKDQLRFAARLIRNVLSFKAMVDSYSLPVDMQGKSPLTMIQYKKLLSTCRIPKKTGDYAIVTPKEESRHIIVMHNNHFFTLDVYHYGSIKRLSEDELVFQLEKIVQSSPETEPNPIGALTTTDRTTWASNWKKLRRDSVNRFSLDTVVKSIFVLCLDGPGPSPTNTPTLNEDPVCSVSLAQSLHGGGADSNSCNRYFDKIIQVYVSPDGHNGICYEHSSAEGPPVQVMCNYILQNSGSSNISEGPITPNLEPPKKLSWRINPALQDQIEVAMDNMDSMADDVELKMIRYKAYGKNFPKKLKLSPDAYLQMAFQLGYYRIHGHSPPTYETASIRRFKRGRTETIRSSSAASEAFCRAMDLKELSDVDKRDLFKKAVASHTKYTKEASVGQGIDRHLLGLKLIAGEQKLPLPEIFRDKGYTYSAHFKLSTSQVPSPFDTALCFGPVVPDGYGVCYNPMEEQVNLSVSAFNSNPSTNASLFGESIAKALDDLQLLHTNAKL